MISLTFLWKNGTNIANGNFKFGELRKSEFDKERKEKFMASSMTWQKY